MEAMQQFLGHRLTGRIQVAAISTTTELTGTALAYTVQVCEI